MEIWLRPNQRYLTLQLSLYGILAVGLIGASVGAWRSDMGPFWTLLLVGGAVVGVGLVFRIIRQLRTPRLAWSGAYVHVALEPRHTYQIPLEFVECFFLGQGAAGVPLAETSGAASSTVVVRLAERAVDWQRRPVGPNWGHWCDGYITLRGTWCEPISVERINEMNRKLAAAKRQTRGESAVRSR